MLSLFENGYVNISDDRLGDILFRGYAGELLVKTSLHLMVTQSYQKRSIFSGTRFYTDLHHSTEMLDFSEWLRNTEKETWGVKIQNIFWEALPQTLY